MSFIFNKYLSSTKSHRAILFLITIIISTKGITVGETWWSDASQHAMNGVFFLDLIKHASFHLDQLYDYTIGYYFRYPALTLGFHPPFFPLVESLFFAVFGISIPTAKLTVVFFVLIGTVFWYQLIKLMYDKLIAFFSTIVLFTTPLITLWSREIMLEIPALTMVIISLYCFYIFIEQSRPKYAYLLTGSIILAILTKQTTVFIIPLFICYIFLTKNVKRVLNKETLISAVLFVLCISLTIAMTFFMGRKALTHVTLSMDKLYGFSKLSSENLLFYVKQLPEALSLPIFIISCLSIIFFLISVCLKRRQICNTSILLDLKNKNLTHKLEAYVTVSRQTLIKKRSRPVLLFILWIIVDYLIITFISVKEQRYLIFLIPPFSILATLLLFELKIRIKKVSLALILAFILGIFQTARAYTFEHHVVSGYEKAAKYIAGNPKGFGILVYAYYCGNFIFHFRKYDTTQKNFLLRGDKLIHKYYINSNEDEALIQLINDYGIKYVIVESFNSKYLSYIKQTKKILNTNKFIKLKEIKLTTDIRAYTNSSILIYEYKGQPQINKKFITYDLNLAGQTITYPINLLINHETTDNF